ncbi:MAG: hypothetical protein GY798_28395 [Hyphomicrobiales bacterium]|nr:hypothetical protein [Hyphomicrobiales bacterium]
MPMDKAPAPGALEVYLANSCGFPGDLPFFGYTSLMKLVFNDFELDPGKAELTKGGSAVPIEPRVFSLLTLIVENSDRLVSRDEVIERVWEGRVVSDTAVASCVKAARRVVDNDGTRSAVSPMYERRPRRSRSRSLKSPTLKPPPFQPRASRRLR